MARRKEAAHGGGHGWFVTFADLMGLLVAFFVMLVASSTQDKQKLQIVAGSMRDAFGVQDHVRYSGIVEMNGLPTRPKLKNAAQIDPLEASATPTPDEHDRQRSQEDFQRRGHARSQHRQHAQRKGDVGGGGNGPAMLGGGIAPIASGIDQSRSDHAAQGRETRQRPA